MASDGKQHRETSAGETWLSTALLCCFRASGQQNASARGAIEHRRSPFTIVGQCCRDSDHDPLTSSGEDREGSPRHAQGRSRPSPAASSSRRARSSTSRVAARCSPASRRCSRASKKGAKRDGVLKAKDAFGNPAMHPLKKMKRTRVSRRTRSSRRARSSSRAGADKAHMNVDPADREGHRRRRRRAPRPSARRQGHQVLGRGHPGQRSAPAADAGARRSKLEEDMRAAMHAAPALRPSRRLRRAPGEHDAGVRARGRARRRRARDGRPPHARRPARSSRTTTPRRARPACPRPWAELDARRGAAARRRLGLRRRRRLAPVRRPGHRACRRSRRCSSRSRSVPINVDLKGERRSTRCSRCCASTTPRSASRSRASSCARWSRSAAAATAARPALSQREVASLLALPAVLWRQLPLHRQRRAGPGEAGPAALRSAGVHRQVPQPRAARRLLGRSTIAPRPSACSSSAPTAS